MFRDTLRSSSFYLYRCANKNELKWEHVVRTVFILLRLQYHQSINKMKGMREYKHSIIKPSY